MESIDELMSKYTLNELKLLYTRTYDMPCDLRNKMQIASAIYDYRASTIRTADLCKNLIYGNVTRKHATPQPDAFAYDCKNEMLTIASENNSKIYMHPKDVVDFMNSIKPLMFNRHKLYTGPDVENTKDDLRTMLTKENYKKLPGPIDCEVWGCFSDTYENLLMLEIIYPYTGSRHINVALDLGKF